MWLVNISPDYLFYGFLGGASKSLEEDIINGIRMTGHFIARQIFGVHHQPMAEARQITDMVVMQFGQDMPANTVIDDPSAEKG